MILFKNQLLCKLANQTQRLHDYFEAKLIDGDTEDFDPSWMDEEAYQQAYDYKYDV